MGTYLDREMVKKPFDILAVKAAKTVIAGLFLQYILRFCLAKINWKGRFCGVFRGDFCFDFIKGIKLKTVGKTASKAQEEEKKWIEGIIQLNGNTWIASKGLFSSWGLFKNITAPEVKINLTKVYRYGSSFMPGVFS